ncbi:MAG: carboxylesterase family protein [Chitinophagales bacterium]|nr:carboxylesterase family protein [Chitinophagales bacterium]
MKKTLLIYCLLWGICCSAIAQNSCTNQRYLKAIFPNSQFLPNKVYSKAAPDMLLSLAGVETTQDTDLLLDIRFPPNSDTLTKRPAMVWGHGGGFLYIWGLDNTLVIGSKDNQDIQAIIDTFARRGFVCVSIQYRRGVNPLDATSAKRAVWRGAQDMNAAIRYIRTNATALGIDPNYIFVGGSSAGAFAALHSTYIDPNEKFTAANAQYNLFGGEIAADLGDMNSRPIERITSLAPYQTTTINATNVNSLPTCLFSCWGAIDELSMLSGQRRCPTYLYHGGSDVVVYPNCNEPFAGLIILPEFCGSIAMSPVLNNLGIAHDLHIAEGQPHEYWGALNGEWISGQPDEDFLTIIDDISNHAYEAMRPATPSINGSALACGESIQTYSVPNLPENGAYYCWQVENGTIVAQTSNSISVLWNNVNGNGTVYCRLVTQNVVESHAAVLNVTITQVPSMLNISNITANSIVLSWSPLSVAAVTLQYRPAGSNFWNTIVVNGGSWELSNLDPCTIYEIQLSANCGSSNVSTSITKFISTAPIYLQAKVFLEGVFDLTNNTLRKNLLLQGVLPLSQPYNVAPWNYAGTESVGTSLDNFPANTVDWVLLELRSASNWNSVVERRAALLLTNGEVVDVDGNAVRWCDISANTNYKVVIRHRNHLAAMSGGVWNSGNPTLIDFTTQTPEAPPSCIVKNGFYLLRAGDINANGIINYTDYNLYRAAPTINHTYHAADCNMNATTSSTDFDTFVGNLKAIAPLVLRY